MTGLSLPSSLSALAAKAAGADRVLGRLGLGQKTVPVGDGFYGASEEASDRQVEGTLTASNFVQLATAPDGQER